MYAHDANPARDGTFAVQYFSIGFLNVHAGCCFGTKNSGVSIVPTVSSVMARAIETERKARSHAASTIVHSYESKTPPVLHPTYNAILRQHRSLTNDLVLHLR